jgi:hypothetical protein
MSVIKSIKYIMFENEAKEALPERRAIRKTLTSESLQDALTIGEDMEESPVGSSNGKIREIRLQQLNRGYVINVGCHSFAISTADELVEKLTEYIKNPNETEKKWFGGKLF